MDAANLVPTVDVSNPSATDLAAVDAACRAHGFFLLQGHGLDDVIDRTWDQARRFFESDRPHREAVARDAENPFGWFDRELTKRRRDHKQVFDYADPRSPADRYNRWPSADVFPDLHPVLVEFFDAFSDLADTTAALVLSALGLDAAAHADHRGARANSTVRLNHYPLGDPVPPDERSGLADLGETALGFHTDPGVLTLLLQDDTGGLQALAADGTWVDIEPRPGTVVVNLADAMQVWTNDRYRAAVHRVLTMTRSDRMSIPYFSNPHRDAVIAPIPDAGGGSARYREFAWRDHMRARTEDNYADLGADDTQITDYLVDAEIGGR